MKTILLLIGLFFITTYTFAQSNLNWVTLNTGTTEKINDIYFQSPDVGYIVGENYLFKKKSKYKVVKGASYQTAFPLFQRSSFRTFYPKDKTSKELGFRCVKKASQ